MTRGLGTQGDTDFLQWKRNSWTLSLQITSPAPWTLFLGNLKLLKPSWLTLHLCFPHPPLILWRSPSGSRVKPFLYDDPQTCSFRSPHSPLTFSTPHVTSLQGHPNKHLKFTMAALTCRQPGLVCWVPPQHCPLFKWHAHQELSLIVV